MDLKKSWFGKLFQADTPGNFSIVPEDNEDERKVRVEPRDPVAYPNAANLMKAPETQDVFNRIKLKQEFAPPVRPVRFVQDLPDPLSIPAGPPRPFGERRPHPEPAPRPEPGYATCQAEPADAVVETPAVAAPIPVAPREQPQPPRPPRPLTFHELAGGQTAQLPSSAARAESPARPAASAFDPASASFWPPRGPAPAPPVRPDPSTFNSQASRSDRPVAAARPALLPDPFSDPEPSPRAYRLERNSRGAAPEAEAALPPETPVSSSSLPDSTEVAAGISFPPDHAARAMQTNGRNWGRRSTDRLGPDGLSVVTEANRRWQLLSQFEPDLSDPTPAPRRRATDRPRSGEEA